MSRLGFLYGTVHANKTERAKFLKNRFLKYKFPVLLMAPVITHQDDISSYDLGIATHPCDIHEIIIQQFQNSGKGLFLIPCVTYACHSASVSRFDNNDEWLQYLEQYGLNQTELFDKAVPHYIQPFSHVFYQYGDQVPVRIIPCCKKR